MSIVNGYRAQIPWVDTRTGLLTYEAQRFLNQVFVRIGGPEGQTNTELVVDQYDDAGIEEMRHSMYGIERMFGSEPPPTPQIEHQEEGPPGPFFMAEDNSSARIEALEALVAVMAAEIQDLKSRP